MPRRSSTLREQRPRPDGEEKLVTGLLAGEQAAYEQLMQLYGNRVIATARQMLGSADEAADVFQETFVQVFRSIDTFEGRSTLWYWMRGIAINQSLMRLRQRKRLREESIDALIPSYDGRGHRLEPTERRTPDDIAHGMDLREYVREAIARLPDNYRAIIMLRDFKGYSTRESAEMLGIEANAAKVRLHRARAALKTLLEPVTRRDDFI